MLGERRIGRWRVRDVLLVVAVAYVALRLRSVLAVHEVWGAMPDSAGYRTPQGAAASDLVSLRGNAIRPWTVPAVYAVLPSDGWRAGVQVAASIGAWLWLAGAVAREVVRPWLAVAAFVAVLVLSCSWMVILWDVAILSESLALSLGAALVAAWLGFLRARSWWSAAAIVGLAVAWQFTRTPHVPVVAASAVAAFGVAAVDARRLRRGSDRSPVGSRAVGPGDGAGVGAGGEGRSAAAGWAGPAVSVAVGLAVVALWGGLTLGPNDRAYAVRDGYGVSLFGETFALNLRFVILGDPEAKQWFLDAGMPEPAGLEPYHRQDTIHGDQWETWAPFFEAYRADAELRAWVETDGRAAFSRWTASHAPELAGRFATQAGQVLVPPGHTLGYAFPEPILPGPVQALVAPQAEQQPVPFAVVLLAGAAVASAARRRLPPNRRLAALGAALVALSIPSLFLAWLGSPVEYARHALPFSMALGLGALLLAAAALDGDPRPARPADRTDGGLRLAGRRP